MATTARLVLRITSQDDVLLIRTAVRAMLLELGFGLVDQTKMVTAASELARNLAVFAGEGVVVLERVESHGRVGVRVAFEDAGPGIPDIALAMKDGYSTGGGLGLGLGGAKRLVDEFEIDSSPGRGTRVVITRWR